MKKSIVIAGFSGIGKTELAKKYSNVVDLDSAEYVYDDSDILDIPFERRKGEKRKPNPLWPQNYINKIKEVMTQYDFVLVWDRKDIIEEYIKNDIEFVICYPSYKDLFKYYGKRYIKRGNSRKYIRMKMIQYFKKKIYFRKLNAKKIILNHNETLEDYLLKNNYKLIRK